MVLGLVLLVAVTVVLAGVVAVLASALGFPWGSRLSSSSSQSNFGYTTTILFVDLRGEGPLDRVSYRLAEARSSNDAFGAESDVGWPPAFGPLAGLVGDPATARGPLVFVDADGNGMLSAGDFFVVHVLRSLGPLVGSMTAQLARAEAGAPAKFTQHVADEVSEEVEDALEELLEEEDDSLQERLSEAAEELREAVEELYEHPEQVFVPAYAARLGGNMNATAEIMERLAGWNLLYEGTLMLLDPSGNLFATFSLAGRPSP